jgi:hypothetical protein
MPVVYQRTDGSGFYAKVVLASFTPVLLAKAFRREL